MEAVEAGEAEVVGGHKADGAPGRVAAVGARVAAQAGGQARRRHHGDYAAVFGDVAHQAQLVLEAEHGPLAAAPGDAHQEDGLAVVDDAQAHRRRDHLREVPPHREVRLVRHLVPRAIGGEERQHMLLCMRGSADGLYSALEVVKDEMCGWGAWCLYALCGSCA